MPLPPPNPHTLPSTFIHAGWKIKFALLTPPAPPQNNNQTSQQAPQTLPTLVFIHGTPWSSIVFQPLATSLLASRTHQILLYDLPGYGQSQERSASFPSSSSEKEDEDPKTDIATQSLALTSLLTHLSLLSPPPSILAHDIGGTIALSAHLNHSLQLSRLLLLDANAVLPWGDGFYSLVRETPEPFARLPAKIYEAVLRAVVRSARCEEGTEGDEWEAALVAPWLGRDGEAQRAFVRQIAQADDADVGGMVGRYGDVGCEVVVVWGAGDGWIPREKVDRLVGMLGERVKRFVVLEGAGHLSLLDCPEEVEGCVREWLGVEG